MSKTDTHNVCTERKWIGCFMEADSRVVFSVG